MENRNYTYHRVWFVFTNLIFAIGVNEEVHTYECIYVIRGQHLPATNEKHRKKIISNLYYCHDTEKNHVIALSFQSYDYVNV